MYGEDRRQEIRRFFFKDHIPITLTILVLNVVFYFLALALHSLAVFSWVAFITPTWFSRPWTALTWPLITGGDPLGLVFACGWFFLFSGSLERSWGSRTYGQCLALVTVLMSLTYWLGSLLVGHGMEAVLAGMWVISGPAAVAWAGINRREQVGLFFIPVPAPVIAILATAIVWYHTGAAYHQPLLGLFALSGCAAAWWYVQSTRYPFEGYAQKQTPFGGLRGNSRNAVTNDRFRDFDREVRGPNKRNPLDLLGWLRERQERRRRDQKLEDMFRRSGYDDPEDRNRR